MCKLLRVLRRRSALSPVYPVESVPILKAFCFHCQFRTSCTFSWVFHVSVFENEHSFLSALFHLSRSRLYPWHTDLCFNYSVYILLPSVEVISLIYRNVLMFFWVINIFSYVTGLLTSLSTIFDLMLHILREIFFKYTRFATYWLQTFLFFPTGFSCVLRKSSGRWKCYDM